MRQWFGILAVAVLLVEGAAGMAHAADDDKKPWKANPERGETLAQKLCATCHIVSGAEKPTTVAGIPSLEAIAKTGTMTRERVKSVLIVPHAAMPDMQLTIKEIGDLTAYLERLAGGRLGGDKARTPDVERDKPKYPSPS
jgi:mono/diheme cytochrome c family protein